MLGYSQLRNIADLHFSWLDEIISALKWGKAEASLNLTTNPTQVASRKWESRGPSFPSDCSAFLPYPLNTRLTPHPAQLKWHTKSLQTGCLPQPFPVIPAYPVISSFFFLYFLTQAMNLQLYAGDTHSQSLNTKLGLAGCWQNPDENSPRLFLLSVFPADRRCGGWHRNNVLVRGFRAHWPSHFS